MNGITGHTLTESLLYKATLLVQVIAVGWSVWIVNAGFLGKALNRLGIRPRTLGGLVGIGFAPVLHGDIGHIVGNTTAFFILGGLVILKGTNIFLIVTVLTALTSGIGIWIFGGENTIHIGASGIIFGFLGFLLLRGYFEREVFSALISLVVCFFYGSRLWRILPLREKFSWEGHLFGFLGGAAAARYLEAIQAFLPANLF